MNFTFVFPGQGSQYVGMGVEIARMHKSAAEAFQQAEQITGYPLLKLCSEGPEELLSRTKYTQPAVFTTSIAMMRVLQESGVNCQATAGHSLGEYSALVAAGVLPFTEALEIVKKRAEMMDESVAGGLGGMAAVIGLEKEAVVEICRAVSARASTRGIVQPANFNAPNQVVISGEKTALAAAITEARLSGAKRVIPLAVSGPFHSSLMVGVRDELKACLQKYEFSTPAIPVVMNASGDLAADPDVIRELLAEQVSSPVRWEDSVRKLAAEGYRSFLEVGPGQILSGLIKRVLSQCRVEHVEDQKSMEKVLAQIGVTV